MLLCHDATRAPGTDRAYGATSLKSRCGATLSSYAPGMPCPVLRAVCLRACLVKSAKGLHACYRTPFPSDAFYLTPFFFSFSLLSETGLQYDMCLTCFERALELADEETQGDVWYNVSQLAIGIGDLGLAYQVPACMYAWYRASARWYWPL
eukprot:2901979-Rhodomonas_salina.1